MHLFKPSENMHSSSSSPLVSKNLLCYKKGRQIVIESFVTLLFLCFLVVISIVCLFSVSSPTQFKATLRKEPGQENVSLPTHHQEEQCDLFIKGQWLPYQGGSSSYYTSSNCRWIPDWKNCFKHGREDASFLNWRWKPDGCELPRFDPHLFLKIVRNKTMLFLGDSVARNQLESLLCLLSQAAAPTEVKTDSEDDDFRTLYVKSHNFTIYFIRSTFLVMNEEIMENNTSTGSFNLHIDKADKRWAQSLPGMDYVIISDAHWFFRRNYLYEENTLIGCVHCSESNVTDLGLVFAIRKSLQTAFSFINSCKDCRGLITLLRTFSPAHFEGGAWNTGGHCNRTSPSKEGDIDLGSVEWEIRTAQVEELERARKEGVQRGQRFEVIDVTKAMLMRPDGHPNSHWGNQWNKGINDCLHWCLPGPIDLWNEFLLAILKKAVSY